MLYVWKPRQTVGQVAIWGKGEGNKPSPPSAFRLSPVWCGWKGPDIPAMVFPAPSLLGFLLFNQHLRVSWRRTASLRHHRSWCGQHGLHIGLGNCLPVEWPHHWIFSPGCLGDPTLVFPQLTSSPPPTPTGALGRTGWATDAPSPRPGRHVRLCHLDDSGSAPAGEAWAL